MSEKKILEKVCYWDSENPLKPVDGESRAANAGLNDYAHMGFSRGLERLYEKYLQMDDPPTTSRNTIFGWSKKYDWVDRSKAYDEIQRNLDEQVWRERRDEVRQKEWDNFDKLQDIVSAILENVPSFVKRKEKIIEKGSAQVVDAQGHVIHQGKPQEKVIILQMNTSDAIKFIRTASDIGRRAAEMNSKTPNMMNEIDFSKLKPEQVIRIAEGENILDVLGVRK